MISRVKYLATCRLSLLDWPKHPGKQYVVSEGLANHEMGRLHRFPSPSFFLFPEAISTISDEENILAVREGVRRQIESRLTREG
jgi:hypothetical protein